MENYLKAELYDLVKNDESIFDFLQESTFDGLWYWDLEKPENEWMNPRFWEVLGYNPEEMPHKSSAWQDIINPDDLKLAINNFNEHVKNPEHPYDQIVRYRHKKGHTVWIRCRGKAIRDKNGKAIRMLGAHHELTELKQTELSLKTSEDRFRSIFKLNKSVMLIIDPETGFIIDANKAAIEFYGYKDLFSVKIQDINILERNDVFEFMQIAQKGNKNHFLFKHKLANKEIRDVEVYSTPLIFNNKEVLFSIVHDISDRKKIKTELEKITNTLQLAEEISQVGSWDWNFKTNKTWWSDGLFKIYGRKKEIGVPPYSNNQWLESVHSNDRKKLLSAIDLAINKKGDYEVEYRLIRENDKAIRTIYAKGRILNDENGNPERLLGTAQDITERKDFEDELFKKEELFKLLYQSSATGVGVYTVDGKIISYNEIALKYLGMKESDVVGKNLHEVFPKKDADVYLERIKATIKKNDSIKFEDKIELPTGSKWFLSVYSCIHNLSGDIEGVQIISVDVTEQKEAQYNSTFLSNSILDLIQFKTPVEVYRYTVNKLFTLLNKSVIVAGVEYDNPNNKWKAIEVKGINSFIDAGLKKIGIDFRNFEGEINTRFLADVEKGMLTELEFDLQALTNGKISGKLNGPVKKLISIKKLLIAPIKKEGIIYGTITLIITKNDTRINKPLIEAFIAQVALFLEKLIIENDLIENENKLKAAEKIAHVGNYTIDLNTGNAVWSEETFRIFGWEYEKGKELTQYEYGKLVHPDDNQKLYKHFEECISEVKTFNLVYRIIRADKEIRYVHSIGKLEINEKGIPIKMFGTLQDITEQVLSEQRLKESEERFNLAMKAANDGVFDWNLVTNEIYYSPKWKGILGYKDHELPNDFSIWETNTKSEDVKKSWEMQQELISKKRDRFVMEFKMKHKDGHWVDILSRAEAVFDENDKAIRIVGTHQDISDQKRFEAELLEAKQKAEESDRLKTAFLANMSHEIRTPMNGILGFTNLLKEPGLTGEEQQSYIEIIQKSGDRMLNTVNDIIEYSRIEAGEVPEVISNVNIKQTLKDMYNFFLPETKLAGLNFVLSENHLEEDFWIKTDINKLESIFTNLIKNSIKFTKKGTIEFGINGKDTVLTFYVKDSGKGIPEERIDAIFDRFMQADMDMTRGHEGSGLGLAICNAYVKMLGGDIWVDSEINKGTTFYFSIKNNSATSDNKNIEKPKSTAFSDSKGKIILIAEDDETSYFLLDTVLSKMNVQLIRTENGRDTVEMCRKNSEIDLVIMDIKMPVMDGIEATRQIRKFNKTLPVIAQTAYALEGDREKMLEAGCNDYVSKPVDPNELIDKVGKLLKLN